MSDWPDTWSKMPHKPDCGGRLYRRVRIVWVDRLGRIGNGNIVAHDYRCTTWHCPARVLVAESAVRALATAAEERR